MTMKATVSLFCLACIIVGFALVGNAIAQPDNPTPAASETSGADSAAASDKLEEGAVDAKDPTPASESSESKTEGEKEADGADSKEGDGGKTADEVAEDPLGAGLEIIKAVKSGNWRYAAALALFLLMFVASKFNLRDKVSIFKGDRGGAILVMVLALLGGVATALASSATLDWKLFLGAAGVAWTAVGGYTWVKRLIWPADKEPTEA